MMRCMKCPRLSIAASAWCHVRYSSARQGSAEESNDVTSLKRSSDQFVKEQGFNPDGVRNLLKGIQGGTTTVDLKDVYPAERRKKVPRPRDKAGLQDFIAHFREALTDTQKQLLENVSSTKYGDDHASFEEARANLVVEKAAAHVYNTLRNCRSPVCDEYLTKSGHSLVASCIFLTMLRFLSGEFQSPVTQDYADQFAQWVNQVLPEENGCVEETDLFLGVVAASTVLSIRSKWAVSDFTCDVKFSLGKALDCLTQQVEATLDKCVLDGEDASQFRAKLSQRSLNYFLHLHERTFSNQSGLPLNGTVYDFLAVLLQYALSGLVAECASIPHTPDAGVTGQTYLTLKQHIERVEFFYELITRVPKNASDSLMTHRTSYPALSDHLNYYSAACNGNMERYRQKMKLSGAWENLQRSSAALRRLTGLVHELSNSVVSAQLVETNDRNLLTTVIVPMTALAIRLVLRLETDISFVASIQLKEVYAAPPSLDMLPHEPSQVPTEDDDWHTVARRCGAVRAECSRFTMEVFSALTATELNEGITTNGKTRPKRKPSQLLLEMVSGSFYSLLRRHYLVTKHQMAHHYSSLADTKVLYDSFLSIFLLLRERHNSTLPISDGDKPVGGDHDRFHTCGVGLQQAMEVSFFLTYYIQHYYKGSSDDALFSPGQVGGYVRDTMESFELNTAKQLRHFRSKGTFFYFSGLTKDGRMCFDKTENFTLYQRFAKSTLSVVHAHVLHPSAVWMPLWQVQEMFYVLRHHRGTLLTGEDRTSQPKGGPRFHGYLVLRLYVISNVLRAYGSLVSSQKVNTALEKLLSLEPAASKKKRVERAWATYLGQAILTDYPFLAATTEGMRVAEHGLLAALSRVEQTIRTAMENELIFDVSKRQKKQKAAKAAESVAEELEPSPPDEDNDVDGETHGESAAEHSIDSERLELTLKRDSTATSYGFVVDKNTLHVTSAKPGTPFAASVEQYAGLRGDLLTQWRITRVNGQDVHNADELIRAIRDTSSCSIELTRWQK